MPKPGTKQESPIAASATAKAILRRLSSRLKLRKIDLLDHALIALDSYVEQNHGKLLLPLDFRQRFTVHQEPMILEEPPAAQESGHGAGQRRTKTGAR